VNIGIILETKINSNLEKIKYRKFLSRFLWSRFELNSLRGIHNESNIGYGFGFFFVLKLIVLNV